jgi:hypothetical protein
MLIGRSPRQPHERTQQSAHGTHAIDEALADDLGTARRSALAMGREKRVQVLPDLPVIGTTVRENRTESASRSWYNKVQSPCVARASVSARHQSVGIQFTSKRAHPRDWGVFFRSRDPKILAAWYHEHLGIDPTPVDYNQPVWQQSAGPTVFAPFPSDTDYFGSPQQMWMVNFRVRNLDAKVRQLRASDIRNQLRRRSIDYR